MATRPILQFKITLQEIEPLIWRRIQISDLCSFWDLHVAIQDAMGWTDSHLHLFTMNHSIREGKHYLGIPDDDGMDEYTTLPGWHYKVRDYLVINERFIYEYDFGDGWRHLVEYEGEHPKQENVKYPLCIAGERACPPEDVGGTPGYERFIEVITTPRHPERKELLEWVGGKYDPSKFDPKKVKFDNPSKRWKQAFERDDAF
ncbi:MAG: hypothetical protein A3F46_05440 [Legionellales bacterium RIFCSPHIGHO2_12_FULL_42_9]|nr:MAG: hypothetical protein A3F46_05440 [Legionellales bacterium RIFCSPHIGHO2_12_FULL_42_9]